jgi:hypothetical protein
VRLQAQSASLCATIDRWAMLMTAKIEGRPLDDMSMRFALASEHILPRWKRQPKSFHTLTNGEVVQFGQSTHTLRTQYLRTQYTANDVDYLTRVVMASRAIMADEADRILRTLKPDTSRPKRRPAEADPDIPSSEYKQRVPRFLSAEDLIRSQFSGRALQRELRRIYGHRKF